jgi:hypothetical protein
VLDAVRKETFGDDIGQNSWLTRDEYDRFISWLQITQHHVLEVASGSGGPASYLAQRRAARSPASTPASTALPPRAARPDRPGRTGCASRVADAGAIGLRRRRSMR